MATDKSESGRGKGFAGLCDLVTEVPEADLAHSVTDAPITSSQSTVVLDPTPASEPEKSPYRQVGMPTGNEPMPPMAKWLAGLVGLMIIFGIVNSTSKKVEDSATYNQPSPSPSYNAPQPPQAPALLEPLYESIPPVGSGQLLNFVQLRFCLGEKIRLDALEVFGHNNVKRYNAKVKFFNDRCSSYRYKVADFNSVTQEVQDRKDLLAQQARLEWFKADDLEAHNKAKAAKANPVRPSRVPGAETSPPPGLPTPSPSPARHTPMANGMPLNAKPDFNGISWMCIPGYRKYGNECTKIELPSNAILDFSGSDWTCKRGFQKRANECIAIVIPKNAGLDYLGSDWTCNRGFQKRANECVAVDIPQNAVLDYLGSDWTCKRGFRKRGNECAVVDIPQNAVLDYLGSDWTCKRGYRQVSNACVTVQVPPHANLDYLGSGWACNPGYRQAGDSCAPN
jgi:hypothetical protein